MNIQTQLPVARKYLGPARDNMEKLYKHKIINVLGSDNKLAE